MRENFSVSIRTGFILGGVLVFFLSIVLMGRYAHRQFENTLVDLTKQQLLMIAKSTASSVEMHLGGHANSLSEIARDPLFRKKNNVIAATGPEQQRLRGFYEAHRQEFESVAILDANGKVLAAWPEDLGGGYDFSAGFTMPSFANGFRPQLSPYFLNSRGQRVVAISVPIVVDKKLVGVACALVTVDTLTAMYIHPIKFSQGAVPVLIDEQGNFLSPPPVRRGRKVSELSACVKGKCANQQIIKEEIAAGRDGVGIFLSDPQGDYPEVRFVAYAPIKFNTINWGVGVVLPFSSIAEPIKRHSRQAIVMAGAVLLFFGIGVTLLFRVQAKQTALEIEARYLQEIAEKATELERVNRVLQEQAIKDELTGLYNYRYFNKVLQRDFAMAVRGKSDYGCMLIDLDHFKEVNDSHGHPFGDLVLRGVGRILLEECRDTDVVARYGGEEFMVLLPDTDLDGSKIIAERIRARLESHVHVEGEHKRRVTASIGVASFLAHAPQSPQDLLAYADKALYQAKAEQRNRVVVYT